MKPFGRSACLLMLAMIADPSFIAYAAQQVQTEQGHYRLEVEFVNDPVQVGENALKLKILDRKGEKPPNRHVQIDVVPWMPKHEHGAIEMPTVREIGGGEFLVEKVNFSMPGSWEVYVRMNDDGREDHAVFDVKVEK